MPNKVQRNRSINCFPFQKRGDTLKGSDGRPMAECLKEKTSFPNK